MNDPLGQTQSPTCSDNYFHATFVFEKFGQTNGRTEICVKIVIHTGGDCGQPRGSIGQAHSYTLVSKSST